METDSKNYFGKLIKWIFFTGLLAGTLDALAASINYYVVTGKGPVIIFVYIASGLLGKQAFSGGQSIALLGLLLHYVIAIIFSAFYFLIYPKLKFLHWNKIFSAILYGIFVWMVMNLGVAPLAITHTLTFHLMKALLAAAILIVCIGIPVSFLTSSFYKNIR